MILLPLGNLLQSWLVKFFFVIFFSVPGLSLMFFSPTFEAGWLYQEDSDWTLPVHITKRGCN